LEDLRIHKAIVPLIVVKWDQKNLQINKESTTAGWIVSKIKEVPGGVS